MCQRDNNPTIEQTTAEGHRKVFIMFILGPSTIALAIFEGHVDGYDDVVMVTKNLRNENTL